MKLERLAVTTETMCAGMTLRHFFEEAVRSNVPGLPFVDDTNRITGRVSVRDVFKHIAIPPSVVALAGAVAVQIHPHRLAITVFRGNAVDGQGRRVPAVGPLEVPEHGPEEPVGVIRGRVLPEDPGVWLVAVPVDDPTLRRTMLGCLQG